MKSVLLSGIVGELGACAAFKQLQSYMHCKFIHNMPLPGARSMRQVDAILLTPYGFYSVEVKNWICTLYVDLKSQYWRAEYPSGPIPVPSPLTQNNAHVRYLQRKVMCNFGNLILFPDDTQLIDPASFILHLSELPNFFANKAVIYSDQEIDRVYEELLKIKKENEAKMIASFILKGER